MKNMVSLLSKEGLPMSAGNMAHGPNVEALRTTLLEVLPKMQEYQHLYAKSSPNITFSINIVGSNLMLDAEIRKRFQDVHFFPNMEQEQVRWDSMNDCQFLFDLSFQVKWVNELRL